MLNDRDYIIADDVLDCKDTYLTNEITVIFVV